MSFNYPDVVAFENSITRERALELVHNKQKYIDAFEKEEPHFRKPENLNAWKRFLTSSNYDKNLFSFAMGAGLEDKEGDWCTAYFNGQTVPVKLLFSKQLRAMDIRVVVPNPTAVKKANKALSDAQAVYDVMRKQSDYTPSGYRDAVDKARDGVERAKFGDLKSVSIHEFMRGNYKANFGLDEAYYALAKSAHEEVNKKSTPEHHLAQSGIVAEAVNVEMVLSAAKIVFGKTLSSLDQKMSVGELNLNIDNGHVVMFNEQPFVVHTIKSEGKYSDSVIVHDVRKDGWSVQPIDDINPFVCDAAIDAIKPSIAYEMEKEFLGTQTITTQEVNVEVSQENVSSRFRHGHPF